MGSAEGAGHTHDSTLWIAQYARLRSRRSIDSASDYSIRIKGLQRMVRFLWVEGSLPLRVTDGSIPQEREREWEDRELIKP